MRISSTLCPPFHPFGNSEIEQSLQKYQERAAQRGKIEIASSVFNNQPA
jgi:hypothetical protein